MLLLTSAPVAVSQPVPAAPVCTYDTCALRIEPGFFGRSIVRGPVEASESIGRVGLFGSDLSSIVEPVPRAFDHARSADRSRRLGLVALAGAVAASIYAAPSEDRSQDDSRVIVGSLVSLGLPVTAGVLGVRAERPQARAVWEYNRSMAPPAP